MEISPKVTAAIDRFFPEAERPLVAALLAGYGDVAHEREAERMHLLVLKISRRRQSCARSGKGRKTRLPRCDSLGVAAIPAVRRRTVAQRTERRAWPPGDPEAVLAREMDAAPVLLRLKTSGTACCSTYCEGEAKTCDILVQM